MKKSNAITLAILLIFTAGVLVFASRSGEAEPYIKPGAQPTTPDITATPTPQPTKPAETKPLPSLQPASMKDALFIGDSRTVGIREYSGLDDADFFCSVGMNIFDVTNERLSVQSVGNVTLSELLSNKMYSKIYIMLGINEIGYNHQSIVEKYGKVLGLIKSKQPDASIFVEANLHVAKSRSDSDKVVNNPSINDLNSKLAAFADNKKVFYIDANTIFDDEGGNLSADLTSDNTHLYAKYYAEWGDWICKETAKYI